MMAGRALGHTGGTLDKLEAIPGFRTALDAGAPSAACSARAGFVLAGQSARLAPADRRLYALRDATATVESIPLIASSILSKKVAEGTDGLVMDVKVGSGAFLPAEAQARELARTLVALGRRLGLRVRALLTDMDQPLGLAIGNAVEVREAIDVLRGGGPPDVRALTVRLGAEMLRRWAAWPAIGAAGAPGDRGRDRQRRRARAASPRRAPAGGRRPRRRRSRPPAARPSHPGAPRPPRAGVVTRVDAGALGRAATLLGAGPAAQGGSDRARRRHPARTPRSGTRVARGDALCTVEFDDPARARAARPLRRGRLPNPGCRRRAGRAPLVLETIGLSCGSFERRC